MPATMFDTRLTVTVAGPWLTVSAPYSGLFRDRARSLGGAFAGGSWGFDARHEARVRAAMVEVYGTDGGPTPTVTVHIDLASYPGTEYERVVLCGVAIAERPERDSRVTLKHGAIIHSGGFPSGGGSVKNPALKADPGTVLEVLDVPAGHHDLTLSGITVIGSGPDRAALDTERAALLHRLAEIDALLADGAGS